MRPAFSATRHASAGQRYLPRRWKTEHLAATPSSSVNNIMVPPIYRHLKFPRNATRKFEFHAQYNATANPPVHYACAVSLIGAIIGWGYNIGIYQLLVVYDRSRRVRHGLVDCLQESVHARCCNFLCLQGIVWGYTCAPSFTSMRATISKFEQ